MGSRHHLGPHDDVGPPARHHVGPLRSARRGDLRVGRNPRTVSAPRRDRQRAPHTLRFRISGNDAP